MSRRTLFSVVLTLILVFPVLGPDALHADDAAALKASSVTELDAVGNASVKTTITAPANLYTSLKINTPNVALLLRKLGFGRGWTVFDNLDAKFNDMKSSIEITYSVRGFARVDHGNRWTVPVLKESNLEIVDIHDRVAIYQVAANSAAGVVNMIERVITPPGSVRLQNNPGSNAFTYEFAPKTPAAGNVDASFNIDHKDSVMSCLAKCYSNDGFSALWVARSRFENTGSCVLRDYRVRFRIEGLSAWSGWRQTAKVYPGQMVADPFFPVFDLEKLSVMTGTRAANLEFEYQYRCPDGRLVTESDSRKLQVLGYNETIFSGLSRGDMTSFSDATEYLPAVLASFTAPNDPAIEQLVGRISGMMPHGNNNAAGSNEQAIAFAKTLYEFMVNNHIAYQTPPSYVNGTAHGQHIKYGRDVLRNHAGTCVDLAILWASACEAVQLEPVLVLLPGHCFPVIKLPKGGILPVESTAITGRDFNTAVQIATKELQQAQSRPSMLTLIDIVKMRKAGVQPIDLPRISDTFLADQGYDFSPKTQFVSRRQYVENAQPVNSAPVANTGSSLVGTWTGNGRNQNGTAIKASLTMVEDGRMDYVVVVQYVNGQSQRFEGNGRWSLQGSNLLLTDQYGPALCPFQVQGDRLAIYLGKVSVLVNFMRSQS